MRVSVLALFASAFAAVAQSPDTLILRSGLNGYTDMIESAVDSKTTAESGNYGAPVFQCASSFC